MDASTAIDALIHAANVVAKHHRDMAYAQAETEAVLQEDPDDGGQAITAAIKEEDQAYEAVERTEADFRSRFPGYDPLAVAYGARAS